MFKTLAVLLLAFLSASSHAKGEPISSLAIGMHQPGQTEALAPAFINAVNRYLQRYEPKLLERGETKVRMTVDYDYDYSIELKVKEREYEIVVTLIEKYGRRSKAQKATAKLAAGVHKTMEGYLRRR